MHTTLFTRRRLAVLGLALATSLGLAGCQRRDHSQTTAAQAPDSAPAPGGELVFAFDGAATTGFALDPHRSAYAPHNRIMRSIFDSLVVLGPQQQIGPWLAKRWTVSPDGKTTTFTLRDDVTFHDGTRFDAAAVKANLDRIRDPKNALFAAADLGPISDVQVVDDFTVQLVHSQPYAPLLAQLSKTNFGLISPAALKQYGDQIGAHPVGTGPFKVASITPGTEVVTERFEPYRWAPTGSPHPGPAWLQRLVFKNVPEEATRVAVLANGQAQAADLIPPQNLVQLRNDPNLRIAEGELLNHNYSLYLNQKRAPWTDAKVRNALRLALDLDAAVKTIYLGTAARAWSPLSPGLFAYDKTLEGSWKSDPAAARATLDELGWKPGPDGIRVKDGQRLSVLFLDSQGNREKRLDLITLLRRQLKDSGFDLRIESQPGGTLLEKVRAGDYDLVAGSQFSPDPDVLRRLYAPSGRAASSYQKTDDPELTGWLEAATRTLVPAERQALYAQAQRRIVEAAYAIPVYVLTYNVVHSSKVRGVQVDQHGFPQFHNASVAQP